MILYKKNNINYKLMTSIANTHTNTINRERSSSIQEDSEMAKIASEVTSELREVEISSRPTSAQTVPVQTHLIYVQDRSGSMHALTAAVEEGFEGWCKTQEEPVEGEDLSPRLTLVQFSHDVEIQHYENIKDRDPLHFKTFGTTSLYDCLGKIFEEYRNEEGSIVLINTDGEENSSRLWSKEMIGKKIKELTEKKKWKFEFSGANQDSWAVGNSIGITNTQDYAATPIGLSRAMLVQRNTSLTYRQESANHLRNMTPAARRAQSQPTPTTQEQAPHSDDFMMVGPPPLTRVHTNRVYDDHSGASVVELSPPSFMSRSQSMGPQ